MGLGCVRSAERRPADAARLFGAADGALDLLGATVWPSNRADYQHWSTFAIRASKRKVVRRGGILSFSGMSLSHDAQHNRDAWDRFSDEYQTAYAPQLND